MAIDKTLDQIAIAPRCTCFSVVSTSEYLSQHWEEFGIFACIETQEADKSCNLEGLTDASSSSL